MLHEKYAENATYFVEEFVVWVHNERIVFVKEGSTTVGPMTLLNLYEEVLERRQAEMNAHVEQCRKDNVCVSCGEERFPYCPLHEPVDEEEISKQFPVSQDGDEGYELPE